MGIVFSLFNNLCRTSALPARLDKKCYHGLKNQGATCYLNTVLQCLYMTEDFRNYIKNSKQCSEDSEGSAALTQELHKLFEKLESAVGTTEGITQCLGICKVHEQQDALEYYQKIIKAVRPPASEVFKGEMSSNSKCLHGHLSEEKDPFISIPLAIKTGQNEVYKVEEGLENFFAHSKLDEDNWLYCEKCDQKNESETWNEIKVYPAILTLYLKRFAFDYKQMTLVKNNCVMDIPRTLDMKNCEYDLYAVINHRGGRSGGHYNALIKSFEDNLWYCFDDSSVTKGSKKSLNHSRLAYLLMYKKKESNQGKHLIQWILLHVGFAFLMNLKCNTMTSAVFCGA
ncbi:ubiquitin carboxyl-terminal hydrolase 47 [Trichomycterus rosablanca]|uniref:ubiquitin carboxyl-terminal hydrolase 47 n=1 Tax=Trichomycterus rosablanca TaxID=2290929 RepID=UPI002F35018D